MTPNDAFHVPLCIAASHPSLPGHFPDQPLVPGVVILEAVADALRAWRGMRLARVVEVKFLAPLLPGEQATIALSGTGEKIRFDVRRDEHLLAKGIVEAASA
ncbi:MULTISPECIES: hydroxymyristoyl-ACP dehydratase [Dyella]|uniref:hydroxymyristoyl-ACP dehydratase n=1 Tax=Dyella TaxID=231454 RepID=UPI001F0D7123|nr:MULTISPECIES: hydroxymyristoyl-ACP dehydratase [Dyella]